MTEAVAWLREKLTLAQIDHHAGATDEVDVQGILVFVERILPPQTCECRRLSGLQQRLQPLATTVVRGNGL